MAAEQMRCGEEESKERLREWGVPIARKRSSGILDAGELSELALGLSLCLRDYRIVYFRNGYHKWGSGGETEKGQFLEKEGRVLLVRRQYIAWDTYSDDSEDYETADETWLMLFEEDLLARKYFDGAEDAGEHGR